MSVDTEKKISQFVSQFSKYDRQEVNKLAMLFSFPATSNLSRLSITPDSAHTNTGDIEHSGAQVFCILIE